MAKTDDIPLTANIQTVKEQILDEQKLVTYVSLSKELCIHVNEAKTILSKVVEEIRQNTPDSRLNVSFILSGLLKNNSGRTTVCSESDLDAQTSLFKNILFKHIYSVSQGSSCVDDAALVSLNKFEDFPLCTGLIKSNLCCKRTSDEIGNLKFNSQVNVDEPKATTAPKHFIKENTKLVLQNGHKVDENVVKVHETKSEPVIKSEVLSPNKVTLGIPNGKSSKKNGNKASKGIAGFFSKSNSAPSTKSVKHVKELIEKTAHKAEVKAEVKEESMDVDVEVNQEIAAKKEPVSFTKSNKNSKKNSTLNQMKKNAKVDKKRKRVLHISDSESDEDNDPFANDQPANHESEDEIPPTPSTNTVKITSGILNPKKRRKIVDKTYTDEEGYILTRKEEVYESCSEDEAEMVKAEPVPVKSEKENVKETNNVKLEVSPKEKKPKSSKKKISPPQKGKQATMMNYFKKV